MRRVVGVGRMEGVEVVVWRVVVVVVVLLLVDGVVLVDVDVEVVVEVLFEGARGVVACREVVLEFIEVLDEDDVTVGAMACGDVVVVVVLALAAVNEVELLVRD